MNVYYKDSISNISPFNAQTHFVLLHLKNFNSCQLNTKSWDELEVVRASSHIYALKLNP